MFVSDFLNTNAGRIQIDRISRQIIGMSNVNAEELRDLVIPLPPLEIQHALVEEMEAARESRRTKLNEADELLTSLDGWLLAQLGLEPPPTDSRQIYAVRLGELRGRVDPYFYQPRFEKVLRALRAGRYPLQTIGGMCEPPVGGATPLRGDSELYAEDGVKFLRILNVKPNNIDLTDVKYIRDSVHEGELERSQLADNDVLMTITGRVGTAAVVSENILPANINQHIVRLRIVSDECLPAYLAAYLNTSVGLAVSNRSVTGGTRIALDYQAIRSLPVPLPRKNIQQTIVEALSQVRADARRLRAEAEAEWQAAKRRFEEQLLTGREA
jgi:restriction endonuclease S subunit